MENFIQTLLFALLPIGGGVVTWFLKAKREESLLIEERAREYKIKTYEALLEPFIGVFITNISDTERGKYFKKLLTVEYRKAGFNLVTFGSDEVVKAYNNLMQHFFHVDEKLVVSDEHIKIMLRLFSTFLLCIRKDLYTKNTKLKRSQMLEFVIKDIENIRDFIDAD